jgi:hypothetical protein
MGRTPLVALREAPNPPAAPISVPQKVLRDRALQYTEGVEGKCVQIAIANAATDDECARRNPKREQPVGFSAIRANR